MAGAGFGEGRGKREEGRGKREEGRGKREEGRGKREEGRGKPPGPLLLHDAGTDVARSSGADRLATRHRFARRGDPIG